MHERTDEELTSQHDSDLTSLAAFGARCRANGERIAFISGVYDLFHSSVLRELEFARSTADVLVVGVLDDGMSRGIGGPGRPVLSVDERIALVESLRQVDYVIELGSCLPIQQLRALVPDVVLVGSEAGIRDSEDFERAIPDCLDIDVVQIPFSPGRSIGEVLESIRLGVDEVRDVGVSVASAQFYGPVSGSNAVTFTSRDFRSRDRQARRTFIIQGVSDDDLILREIREYQAFFERDSLHFAAARVSGGVAIDVGANIGNHTIFFASMLVDLVVSIEPAPVLTGLLRKNVNENGLQNVEIVEAAVGASPGKGFLVGSKGALENWGGTTVRVLSPESSWSRNETVPIRTVDEIIDDLRDRIDNRPITMLKIDVEGNELAVVQGAKGVIENHRPYIMIELTLNSVFNKVAVTLGRLGYVPIARFGGGIPTYHFWHPEAVRRG